MDGALFVDVEEDGCRLEKEAHINEREHDVSKVMFDSFPDSMQLEHKQEYEEPHEPHE